MGAESATTPALLAKSRRRENIKSGSRDEEITVESAAVFREGERPSLALQAGLQPDLCPSGGGGRLRQLQRPLAV